jgi:hypothetical protein
MDIPDIGLADLGEKALRGQQIGGDHLDFRTENFLEFGGNAKQKNCRGRCQWRPGHGNFFWNIHPFSSQALVCDHKDENSE